MTEYTIANNNKLYFINLQNQDHYDVENLVNFGHEIVILKRSTICKPLEEFMRDCNPCKCARDGLSYSCTHNECLETEMDKDKEVEVFMQSEVGIFLLYWAAILLFRKTTLVLLFMTQLCPNFICIHFYLNICRSVRLKSKMF